jgi:hypothetical protein
MGLPTEHATRETRLEIHDILLWGYFLPVEKGS